VRAIFVQHDHASPVGHVGAQFASHGYSVEEFPVVPADRFHDPGVSATFPDPTEFDVVVSMGAPWSVYDEATIGAWVLEELTFLRRAHEAGVPVLGICFGGQALASALGGSVVRAAKSEVGWHTIDTSEPDLVEAGPWFEWHHDQWAAPPGARVVARSDLAEQAFVVGRALAVQFHPELTPSMLDGWLDNGGRRYLESLGLDIDRLRAETAQIADAAEQRARRLVDRFLTQVAVAPLDGREGRPAVPARTTH
jgi:GMP synthase-like glutamine amidotransferase